MSIKQVCCHCTHLSLSLSFKTITAMPQISTFYGIIILMNFADHAPAHFHAWYNEYKVIVSIKDGIVKGDMFTEVVKAEYVDGYRIRLWFNNQMVKVVDLRSSLKGKVFEPLKNLNFFKRFAVKYNTIEWENGADFAPEYLLSLPEA